MKINFFKLIFIVVAFSFANFSFASSVSIVPSKSSVSVGEQFYVDVFVNPENTSINSIEGNITYSRDTLSFVRAEDGTSIIRAWIERPIEKQGIISFSGIIPNGFSGIINPFDGAKKKSGNVIRLVFSATNTGSATITTPQFTLIQNNEQGTVITPQKESAHVNINSEAKGESYNPVDTVQPELVASVTQDQNLFDGKYTLIFQVIDRQTGIQNVFVQEGKGEWKEAVSPYLLEDQNRQSIIKVRAVDFAGNEKIVAITPPLSMLSTALLIIFGAIIIVVCVYIWRLKKYGNKV